MRTRLAGRLAIFIWAVSFLAATAAPAEYPFARETENPTALDRYVAKPDPNYAWEVVRSNREDGLSTYTIDLTSQQWRTTAEVNRPVWKHWLTVCVPDTVAYPTALLTIDGGSNRGNTPREPRGGMMRIARETGTVTASIYMIPNQPLTFTDGMGWSRNEDGIIAYTWDKFLRTGDADWLLRLPMTKAVVRAMDTVQAFCASEAGGGHTIEHFVVAGGSKRGWTTWTTAAVDTRVTAIVPCVIDLLNLAPSFHHHYAVLGRWSVAISDYAALRILDWLDTPENAQLMAIVDPYSYRARLTMPKLIMNGANDQFFLPDSSQFYWNDLEGPKWLRYVPNAGHGLDGTAVPLAGAFHHAIAAGTPIPAYEFAFEDDGVIRVTLAPASNGEIVQPEAVTLWQAHNPKARDFRGNKAEYVPSAVEASEPGVYRAAADTPAVGWTAYFIELTFPGPAPETPFRFTSGVRVLPDVLPFAYESPANPPKGFLSAP